MKVRMIRTLNYCMHEPQLSISFDHDFFSTYSASVLIRQ